MTRPVPIARDNLYSGPSPRPPSLCPPAGRVPAAPGHCKPAVGLFVKGWRFRVVATLKKSLQQAGIQFLMRLMIIPAAKKIKMTQRRTFQ